jgi:hypothetical protein
MSSPPQSISFIPMSKINFYTILLIASLALLTSCSKEDSDKMTNPITTTPQSYKSVIKFNHVCNNESLKINTQHFPYTNAKGQTYRVSRLRYLISNIVLNHSNGSKIELEEYLYVDLSDYQTLNVAPKTEIPIGDYLSITYTFGFDNIDNESGKYSDLNSLKWNWPSPYGGGYYFMQLGGYYMNSSSNHFSTYMGTAYKVGANSNPIFEDNHFTVTIPNSSFTVKDNIEIEFTMDINEWYKNPTNWDFNQYGADIITNYNAQKLLNTNGKDVFTATIN